MLRSIGKHAGKESGDNIYYDRLWEQLYFLKDGELMV